MILLIQATSIDNKQGLIQVLGEAAHLRVIAMEGVARDERREVPRACYKGQRACYFLHF